MAAEVELTGPILLPDSSTPDTPPAGKAALHFYDGGHLGWRDAAGNERAVDEAGAHIARMAVYGHSLAYGGGASDPDRDVTTHLASMLKMREIPRATGGAILHWHQENTTGDGGYAAVLAGEPKKTRAASTSTTAVTGGSSTTVTVASVTGFTVGKLISVGTGALGEVVYITNVAGSVLTVQRPDGTTTFARSHASGEPVYEVPTEYLNLNPLYLLWYGLNDLAASPITSSLAYLRNRYKDPLRLAISRVRCAEIFEESHPSCVYTGSWGASGGTNASTSGGTAKQVQAVNAAVTIHVPDNFPGGTVALGFAFYSTPTSASQTVFGVTVDGNAAPSYTTPSTYNFTTKINGGCHRLTGLAPGRHTIVVTCTTLGTGNIFFDWWGIESVQPPLVLVPGANRPYTFGWSGWLNSRRTTTLTGLHNSGVSSFTVATTANMVKGQMVTFEEGTGNAETLEVDTVPNGTTFTTLTTTTLSHANGVGVVYGMQDADISRLDDATQEVVTEFDDRVVFIEIDSVINKNLAYFWYDRIHFNDRGHAVLTEHFYKAIRDNLTATMVSYVSVPSAPLPSCITFLATGPPAIWTNQPAALTEFLGIVGHRKVVDMRRCHEGRFAVTVTTAGTSGASLRVQYTLDGGATWKYLFRNALFAEDTSHEALLTSTGLKLSAWLPIDPAALTADTILRVVGIGINSTGDPAFGTIDLHLR